MVLICSICGAHRRIEEPRIMPPQTVAVHKKEPFIASSQDDIQENRVKKHIVKRLQRKKFVCDDCEKRKVISLLE